MFRVMYATDKEYAYICATSMISLLENNKRTDEIYIYLFADNLSETDKTRYNELVSQYGRTIEIIESGKIIDKFAICNLPKSRGGGIVTM